MDSGHRNTPQARESRSLFILVRGMARYSLVMCGASAGGRAKPLVDEVITTIVLVCPETFTLFTMLRCRCLARPCPMSPA
jgi:hypothetical protein